MPFVNVIPKRLEADDLHAKRDKRKQAKAQVIEAEREVDLLLNRSTQSTESDFYPYRYLAPEGFLPGYNFARLPLRDLPEGENTDIIDRPRCSNRPEIIGRCTPTMKDRRTRTGVFPSIPAVQRA